MNEFNIHQNALTQALSKRQFEEISECLSALAAKLRIAATILTDSTGRMLSQHVLNKEINTTLLSTLTANTYAAAQEMARLIGDRSNFKMVLHEGHRYNIFVANVNGEYFLSVVFEPGVAMGMVRIFIKKTILSLLPILARKDENEESLDQVFDDNFESLLDEELDRSLKEIN